MVKKLSWSELDGWVDGQELTAYLSSVGAHQSDLFAIILKDDTSSLDCGLLKVASPSQLISDNRWLVILLKDSVMQRFSDGVVVATQLATLKALAEDPSVDFVTWNTSQDTIRLKFGVGVRSNYLQSLLDYSSKAPGGFYAKPYGPYETFGPDSQDDSVLAYQPLGSASNSEAVDVTPSHETRRDEQEALSDLTSALMGLRRPVGQRSVEAPIVASQPVQPALSEKAKEAAKVLGLRPEDVGDIREEPYGPNGVLVTVGNGKYYQDRFFVLEEKVIPFRKNSIDLPDGNWHYLSQRCYPVFDSRDGASIGNSKLKNYYTFAPILVALGKERYNEITQNFNLRYEPYQNPYKLNLDREREYLIVLFNLLTEEEIYAILEKLFDTRVVVELTSYNGEMDKLAMILRFLCGAIVEHGMDKKSSLDLLHRLLDYKQPNPQAEDDYFNLFFFIFEYRLENYGFILEKHFSPFDIRLLNNFVDYLVKNRIQDIPFTNLASLIITTQYSLPQEFIPIWQEVFDKKCKKAGYQTWDHGLEEALYCILWNKQDDWYEHDPLNDSYNYSHVITKAKLTEMRRLYRHLAKYSN